MKNKKYKLLDHSDLSKLKIGDTVVIKFSTIRDYDILNLGTSLLVSNSGTTTNKIVEFTQGINGTFVSYTANDGWGGYINNEQSNAWLVGSVLNGIGSTYGANMLGGSVVEDILINDISGCIQATLNKVDDEKGYGKRRK